MQVLVAWRIGSVWRWWLGGIIVGWRGVVGSMGNEKENRRQWRIRIALMFWRVCSLE